MTTAAFVIERLCAPPSEKSHRCRLPGFFRRHRLGLRRGAIVRCVQCGTRYEWTYTSGYSDDWWEWTAL